MHNPEQFDPQIIDRLFGGDGKELGTALENHLSGTNSLQAAIDAARLDQKLGSQTQSRLDTFEWIYQASNASLALVDFCLSQAPMHRIEQASVAATTQALAGRMITIPRECSGIPNESNWIGLRERLFAAKGTSVILSLIQSGQLPVRPEECKGYVVAVLQQAVDTLDFDIAKQSIRTLLPTSEAGEKLFKKAGVPAAQYPAVASYLCTLQRLQALVNEPADIAVLIRCGFSSAEGISRHTVKRGKSKMVQRGVAPERAEQIYNLASLIASRNQHICTRALTLRGTGSNMDVALTGIQSPKSLLTAKEQEDINFSTMFGLDSMGCEECASLTGTAAFYVDLLHRLSTMDISNVDNPPSLLDKLFERRPDLGELELSCGNADVKIPYVDLVNEALETVVWRLNQGIKPIIHPFNAADGDTDEGNLMQPHNTNYQVYKDVVQLAVSPMHTFPYNQAIHSIRAYLNALGASRLGLLDVFRSPYSINGDLIDDVNEALDHARSAEALNLLREDYVAITKQGFYSRELVGDLRGTPVSEADYKASIGLQEACRYWGFESNTTMLDEENGLARIRDFVLPRSGISIQDLISTIRTQYLNEALAIEILKRSDGKDPQPSELLENMRLRKWGSNGEMLALDEDVCDRLHVFIRLQQKVGWPVHELDAVLMSLGEGDKITLTPTLLDQLAAVKELAELTGRSPTELQPFWADINTHGPDSLYTQLFLTAVLPSKTRQILTPDGASGRLSLENVSRFLDEKELLLPTVLMGLKLTPDEFDAICLALNINLPAELTLANISAVYRVSVLCQILKVSPHAYAQLLLLQGNNSDPFLDPSTTLRMVKEYVPLQPVTSHWTLDRLLFVVSKIPSNTDQASQPTVDQDIRVIEAVRSGLNDPTIQASKIRMEDGSVLPSLVTELIPDPESSARLLEILETEPEPEDPDDSTVDLKSDDDEAFITKALAPILGTERAHALAAEIMATSSSKERVRIFLNAFMPASYREKQCQSILQSLAPFFPALSMATLQLSLENLIQVDGGETVESGMDTLLSLADADDDNNPDKPFDGYFRPPVSGHYLILSAADQKPEGAVLDETPLDFQERGEGMVPKYAAATDSLTGGRWLPLHYGGPAGDLSWIPGDADHAQLSRPASFKPTELMDSSVVNRVAPVVVDLMRIVLLIDQFNVQDAEVEFGAVLQCVMAARGVQRAGLNGLVVKDVWALSQYLQFRETFGQRGTTGSLLELYKWLLSFAPSEEPGEVRKALAEKLASASGWSKSVCTQYLDSKYPASNGTQLVTVFQDMEALVQMETALEFLKRLGLPSLSLGDLFAMAHPAWWDLVDADFAQAEILRLAIQSRRFPSSSSGPTALSEASDSIRTSQQKALIHMLLADQYAQDHDLKTPDQLFGHFLIDVEMGPGLQTSRITQATSSIQLFAHRCSLGLEKEIGPGVLDRGDLEYILRYRLWEADRKAYLYPENWADPTLRDNKTMQFRELESKAMQPKLDVQSIASMIKEYVHQTNAIGNLRAEAYVIDNRNGGRENVFYLFACSRSSPPQFYYRPTLIPKVEGAPVMPLWSSWIPLDVDISVIETESNGGQLSRPGSYIVPAVYRERVLLFLPEITLGQRRNTAEDDKPYSDLLDKKVKDLTPSPFWEIRMGFSELCNGQWSPKTVFRPVIRVTVPSEETPSVANFIFRAEYREDTSELLTVSAEWIMGDKQYPMGFFQLRGQEIVLMKEKSDPKDPSKGNPVSEIDVDPSNVSDLKRDLTEFNRFSPDWVPGWENERDPKYPDFQYQYKLGDSKRSRKVFTGKPRTLVNPGLCEWLMDFSYPLENAFSALIFDAAEQNRIEQFIDLRYTEGFRVDYLYNRASPTLAERAQLDQGLEGVYDVLKAIQRDETNDPHEDSFGRWTERNSDTVHYHERSVPYAIYNWELGVHIPMLLAERLMATQQFELALKVIRLVFDPSMDGEGISRCWVFPPFREESVRNPSFTPDEARAVNEWQLSGGNVHSAARSYPVAYMKRIAGKYIELLLVMGDEYFRRDTLESIPLASQFYVEASQLFGPQPYELPQLGKRQNQTYNQLKEHLTALSNAYIDLELDFPFYVAPGARDAPSAVAKDHPQSFLNTGYFCIPSNPQLLSLRSQIDDRLYKIRNGMDISGKKRTLALTAPAMDPGALQTSKGSAGGIAGFLNDLETPMPRYRFSALMEVANDLCLELKAASSMQLGLKESKDGEGLALVKSRHSKAILALKRRVTEIWTTRATFVAGLNRSQSHYPASQIHRRTSPVR